MLRRRLSRQSLLGHGNEPLPEVGEIAVPPVTRHQLAEGGGVGQREQVHALGGGRGGGDGPEEQLRTDGDPDARLGHGQGCDGVFRLQDQLGLKVIAAEISDKVTQRVEKVFSPRCVQFFKL